MYTHSVKRCSTLCTARVSLSLSRARLPTHTARSHTASASTRRYRRSRVQANETENGNTRLIHILWIINWFIFLLLLLIAPQRNATEMPKNAKESWQIRFGQLGGTVLARRQRAADVRWSHPEELRGDWAGSVAQTEGWGGEGDTVLSSIREKTQIRLKQCGNRRVPWEPRRLEKFKHATVQQQ